MLKCCLTPPYYSVFFNVRDGWNSWLGQGNSVKRCQPLKIKVLRGELVWTKFFWKQLYEIEWNQPPTLFFGGNGDGGGYHLLPFPPFIFDGDVFGSCDWSRWGEKKERSEWQLQKVVWFLCPARFFFLQDIPFDVTQEEHFPVSNALSSAAHPRRAVHGGSCSPPALLRSLVVGGRSGSAKTTLPRKPIGSI